MSFNNGMYAIRSLGGLVLYLHDRSTVDLSVANGGCLVVGYARNAAPNCLPVVIPFLGVSGNFLEFVDIDAAEDYVFERGWDDDVPNPQPYVVIRVASLYRATHMKPNAQWTRGYIGDPKYSIAGTYQEKPKCDCGGDKCKLPHMTWCSVYKAPE